MEPNAAWNALPPPCRQRMRPRTAAHASRLRTALQCGTFVCGTQHKPKDLGGAYGLIPELS